MNLQVPWVFVFALLKLRFGISAVEPLQGVGGCRGAAVLLKAVLPLPSLLGLAELARPAPALGEVQELLGIAGAVLQAAGLVGVPDVGDIANLIAKLNSPASFLEGLPANAVHVEEVLHVAGHLLFRVILAAFTDHLVVDGIHTHGVPCLAEVVARRLLAEHGVGHAILTAILREVSIIY